MIEVWERAWLAAAIDGEGSISWSNQGTTVTLVVYNTGRAFVREAARILGKYGRATLVRHNIGNAKPHYKICYAAKLCALGAVGACLRDLLPFLTIKRRRAERAIKTVTR